LVRAMDLILITILAILLLAALPTWRHTSSGRSRYQRPTSPFATGTRPVIDQHRDAAESELKAALRACKSAFIGIGLMTASLNVLYLTGSFFMMLIYDRVLPSHSVPTLVGLAIIAAILYAFQAFLDVIRGRGLVRIGAWFDEALSYRTYDVLTRLPLKTRLSNGLQPLNDLDQLRGFLSSIGPTALFDLPWMPLYLAICFAFHLWIGIAAAASAALLIFITFLTEAFTRRPVRSASEHAAKRMALAEVSRRNAEVLQAMGMAQDVGSQWVEANAKYMRAQHHASDVVGGFGALSRVFRLLVQSGMLGLGAYLVINQEATLGVIIAASILTSRALAPIEQAITHWKGFVAARQSWRRLNELLDRLPPEGEPMALPAPHATLSVENVVAVPPGSNKIVVQDVRFGMKSGDALGIIGPSASGKSSLARMLVNVWSPAKGEIRLDGAGLDQWSTQALGKNIGYLPQDVELFAGTVAQNIARFEPSPDPEAIIVAAKASGVHDLVLHLSDGYETQIGEGGEALSAGQRQRVGLARALYGNPFLVVLDEPSSNLDAEGEAALTQAILGVRSRGGIAIVIAHRPSALAAVDHVLVMAHGRQQALGPRDEVLRRVLQLPPPVTEPAMSEPLRNGRAGTTGNGKDSKMADDQVIAP
jgi:PrtD family type I secretion system ABC transporter